ncbi:MAG: redoxin domain-containing protein [Candidatus Rokubacteria bacterium]|nr:redoxin domain-containing protein [Candidatus Rokubacteria bacterium]
MKRVIWQALLLLAAPGCAVAARGKAMKGSRWITVVGLLLLVAMAQGAAADQAARVPAEAAQALELLQPATRVQAPDFVLRDLEGRPVRLSDLRGQVVMLAFFGTA